MCQIPENLCTGALSVVFGKQCAARGPGRPAARRARGPHEHETWWRTPRSRSTPHASSPPRRTNGAAMGCLHRIATDTRWRAPANCSNGRVRPQYRTISRHGVKGRLVPLDDLGRGGCAQSQASLRIVWRWMLKGVSTKGTRGAQINLGGIRATQPFCCSESSGWR